MKRFLLSSTIGLATIFLLLLAGWHTPAVRQALVGAAIDHTAHQVLQAKHQQDGFRSVELIRCFFASASHWSFDQTEGTGIEIETYGGERRQLGQYLGGTMSLRYDMDDCLEEMAGSDEAEPFDHVSALLGKPFLSNPEEYMESEGEMAFVKVNPAFVRELHTYHIPEPEERILGLRAQTLYSENFSRFFRLLAESYLYLQRRTVADAERAEYFDYAVTVEYAPSYLYEHFEGVLEGPEYMDYEFGQEPLSGPVALGFWMRRQHGGSAEELWTALQKVLYKYDRAWFGQLLYTYGEVPTPLWQN